MRELNDKLKIIYKPFVLIAIGFILAYTFLHWLLFIKADIPLKEDIIKIWLPIGLPLIPILIWLRPRIKLLHFKNDNGSFFCQLLAYMTIVIPTIIAQEYLVTATGNLTQLDRISQFCKSEKTKYYSLKKYFIDKQNIAIQSTASVTGNHKNNLIMRIYLAAPILNEETDTTKKITTNWLGKKYSERTSNKLSKQEKDEKYKAFAKKCQKEFEETNFSKFTYLEVMGNTKDRDEFNNAIKKNVAGDSKNNIIFEAKNEPFEARNGKKLPWIFGSLGIGMLVCFIFLLFPKFQENELQKFKSGEITKDTDLENSILEANITLPVWKGFRSRQGAYCFLDSNEKSNGKFKIYIECDAWMNTPTITIEHIRACEYIMEHSEKVSNSILKKLFIEYKNLQTKYEYEVEVSKEIMPDIDNIEQFKELIGLSRIYLMNVSKDGIAYVGYEFGCTWDGEHGLGFMTHKDRIVDFGGADTSFLAWIAEADLSGE